MSSRYRRQLNRRHRHAIARDAARRTSEQRASVDAAPEATPQEATKAVETTVSIASRFVIESAPSPGATFVRTGAGAELAKDAYIVACELARQNPGHCFRVIRPEPGIRAVHRVRYRQDKATGQWVLGTYST